MCAQSFSHVQLSAVPWTVSHQAPLPMEFSRQEYWSGAPFPTSGDLPESGIEAMSLGSPAFAGQFFTRATWEAAIVKNSLRDFPGGPVGKTLPSSTGGEGSKPGLGATILHVSWHKIKNKADAML